jgi:hypothetical protein
MMTVSRTAHPLDDPTVQLERLDKLRTSGGLTKEEFDAVKAELMKRLLEG